MPGYDREFTVSFGRRTRRRTAFATSDGTPTRFVVQLEYRLNGGWREVARFDHHPDAEMGHDVTEEGLHPDVYRDGEKWAVERDFPTVNLTDAIAYCESYLERNEDDYVERFERWHETNG